MNNKIRNEIIARLEAVYHDVKPALIFSNSFELLIAVILSAQCTDERVNITTRRLFAKAKTPQQILKLTQQGLEAEIRDCGLFRNKAKNIYASCKILCEKYGGKVPSDFEALLELPGVGRKTANVVCSLAFNRPAIAVDTHVFRVANRLQLAVASTPLAVEEKLEALIPRTKWSQAHHWLIWHGRKLCKARRPLCKSCFLNDLCPAAELETE